MLGPGEQIVGARSDEPDLRGIFFPQIFPDGIQFEVCELYEEVLIDILYV